MNNDKNNYTKSKSYFLLEIKHFNVLFMSFKYWIEKAVITTKLPNGVHDSNSFKVKASILNTN